VLRISKSALTSNENEPKYNKNALIWQRENSPKSVRACKRLRTRSERPSEPSPISR
jgi:hypothetical protein